ncbi:MAG: 4-hydroxybenzoate octaprenyltransferase [Burkholderiales bacterium]|nr:4-hydroxybenzoate octaprenyltransferase [Burkholderiales bacterium]
MNWAQISDRLTQYERLMRLDKPIGTLLLLWPTLWALWIAADGAPSWWLLWIFSLGTLLMRSAGCVVNDWADRDFDRHVKRTADRPLTAGTVSQTEAWMLAAFLALCALALIIRLPRLVLLLSVVAVFLAVSYPFTKRFFALPQAYLGVAFGFGIPMAYAAVLERLPAECWWLLAANILWAIAYDTEYAMVDRDDDVKIGIRTSAILFGRFDVAIVMACYAGALAILAWVGRGAGLGVYFYAGLVVAVGIALYHYKLIAKRTREGCFKAFMHNNWLGAAVFAGIAVDYAVRRQAWPGALPPLW